MLSQVERAILSDLLSHGDNVPGNIADNTGHHPKSISRSLSDLDDDNLVKSKGRGVWTLTDRGQEIAEKVSDDALDGVI
jgi:predicted transcriptional regulator